jgi:hypothetical protein
MKGKLCRSFALVVVMVSLTVRLTARRRAASSAVHIPDRIADDGVSGHRRG